MMVWVLDAGPLGILASKFNPQWAWPAGTLHVVQEVAEEAARHGSRLLDIRADGDPILTVHVLLAGSETARYLYEELRPDDATSTKNRGEHATIAWCVVERSDAIFVTLDKSAAYLALEELGPGRVSTPFDVWRDLRSRSLVSDSEYRSLCEATSKKSGRPRMPLRLR